MQLRQVHFSIQMTLLRPADTLTSLLVPFSADMPQSLPLWIAVKAPTQQALPHGMPCRERCIHLLSLGPFPTMHPAEGIHHAAPKTPLTRRYPCLYLIRHHLSGRKTRPPAKIVDLSGIGLQRPQAQRCAEGASRFAPGCAHAVHCTAPRGCTLKPPCRDS